MKKNLAVLLLALMLVSVSMTSVLALEYEGSANVDGRNYPSVSPFIHPPFYNVLVKVETDAEGKIISVKDAGTGLGASLETTEQEERWIVKNKPFWEIVLNSGAFAKFEGKTLEEIKAMNFKTGEADAISGATQAGLALQEAVINAVEGKQGKKFLSGTGSVLPVVEQNDTKVVMQTKLPEDFKISLLDIRQGIYNAEDDKLADDKYTFEIKDDKATITFNEALKPGKYFVNIVDANNIYRAPNFESGHGEEDAAQAPRFFIESDAKLSFEDGKIVSSENDVENIMKNLEHVLVLKEGDEKAKEFEKVGHHGTTNKSFNLFTDDGVLNTEAIIYNREYKKEYPLFEKDAKYEITVQAFGYEELKFIYIGK